ncbi:hypothetical protein [Clostridium amazonitimonense]|uniref:hypothetical protein n=1 Tax=Clostridium amazonitimonense TaxID=1499689 RepID=UPI00068F31E5|nr:hypothetical protein [Clostridium amazonitimonense]
MSIFKLFKDVKEYNKDKDFNQEVMTWAKKGYNKNYLNVISVPYNNSVKFLDIILNLISENKKVLYITNEDIKDIYLLKQIRKDTSFRNYCYFRGNCTNIEEKLLVITNYENANLIEEKFFCVIYDDVSCYSDYGVGDIRNLMYKIKAVKYITYSIESILEKGEVIEIPIKKHNIPITEPRIITTKIDINKEIPYMIYDYMKWFVKSRRKVILYAPDRGKADTIYEYLLGLREEISTNTIRYNDKETRKIQKLLRVKDEPLIIVMDSMNNFHMGVNNLDIVVYFADDERYNYKKLTYICGKVGMEGRFSNSEVIFLANNTTIEMEKAKSITRNFNKLAWERGLINI